MTALSTLARMLGVRRELAEDALHSERAAKAVLSRRSLFAAVGAMVGGVAFGFGGFERPWDWMMFADGVEVARGVTGEKIDVLPYATRGQKVSFLLMHETRILVSSSVNL